MSSVFRPKPGMIFSGLPVLGEYSEGGGFGPIGDFRGKIIASGFQIDRRVSDPPKPDQNLAYHLGLYLQFQVYELLDEKETWEMEPTKGIFDLILKVGSLQYFYAFNEWMPGTGALANQYVPGYPVLPGVTPDKAFAILDLLHTGFSGNKDTGAGFQLISWDIDGADGKKITGREANETTRGRWYTERPGAGGKKINSKSGYARFEAASVLNMTGAHSDRLIVMPGKGKDAKDHMAFDLNALSPVDGMPYGADYFVGIAGLFGFAKEGFTTSDGKVAEMKSIYIHTIDEWSTSAGADATTTTSSTPASSPNAPASPSAASISSAAPSAASTSSINTADPIYGPLTDAICAYLYTQPSYTALTPAVQKPAIQGAFPDTLPDFRKLRSAALAMMVEFAAAGGIAGRAVYDPAKKTYTLTREEADNQALIG